MGELSKAGLFIDELNKLRIVDPNVTQDTNELKEECEKYLQSMWLWLLFGYFLLYSVQLTLESLSLMARTSSLVAVTGVYLDPVVRASSSITATQFSGW
ncbi:unnamed protein product [Echinostoma caproni]|uniref:MFS domain-containing protein n=1 Tax=Echinostoma caproni TaxID=27848 RepID=A0A183BAZ9_9TREM|nr:unnamed protein product [Echinostoma caproni]